MCVASERNRHRVVFCPKLRSTVSTAWEGVGVLQGGWGGGGGAMACLHQALTSTNKQFMQKARHWTPSVPRGYQPGHFDHPPLCLLKMVGV